MNAKSIVESLLSKSVSKIAIIGAGGQLRSMIPMIRVFCAGYDISEIGLIVADPEMIGKQMDGYYARWTDESLPDLVKEGYHFINAIGKTPVDNPIGRRRMHERLLELGAPILGLQSSCSIVHGSYSAGSVIHDLAYVGPGSVIGEGSIINTGAIVEHDAIIGAHCHIAPGAVIIGGIRICEDTMVGAGSVVAGNIDSPGFYGGVPARLIVGQGPQIIKPRIFPGAN